MSDLISRSALYNKLVELETLARNRVLDTPINNPCYQRYVSQMNERTMLKELVADLSTAYNVDKVVAELEEMNMNYFLTIANTGSEKLDIAYGYTSDAINKAIEIVRRGGVE